MLLVVNRLLSAKQRPVRSPLFVALEQQQQQTKSGEKTLDPVPNSQIDRDELAALLDDLAAFLRLDKYPCCCSQGVAHSPC